MTNACCGMQNMVLTGFVSLALEFDALGKRGYQREYKFGLILLGCIESGVDSEGQKHQAVKKMS